MDKLKTQTNFKIQDQVQGFEVLGYGEPPTKPMQIGEWWVMPAELYKGKIPVEIQQKMFSLLNSGMEVSGFLVAEDMRVIEERKLQEEKKKEAREKVLRTAGGIALASLALPIITLGLGVLAFLSMLWAFDPMLLAVLKDGRWICLGEWFD